MLSYMVAVTLKKVHVDPPFMQPYSIAVWSARSVAEAKTEFNIIGRTKGELYTFCKENSPSYGW
jgi:hypothetical protein